MKCRNRVGLFVLAFFLLLGFSVGMAQEEKKPESQKPKVKVASKPQFDGAVLVFAKQDFATVLERAEIRTLGGRSFIVGEEGKSNLVKQYYPGHVVWVPWDDVTKLVQLK